MMPRPGRYIAAGKDGIFQAEIVEQDGDLFAQIPQEEVLLSIPPAHRMGAAAGDQVQIILGPDQVALVVGIIGRLHREMLGEIEFRGNQITFVPDIRRLGDFLVARAASGLLEDHQSGDRLVARRVEMEGDAQAVELLRRVDEDSPEYSDFSRICLNHELPGEFPEEVVKAAEVAGERLKNIDGRKDCRSDNVFTIDPETAKDFDDAIAIERNDNGGWRVSVHIADVSHFVPQDETIDKEARLRGTSCYLVNRVIPMLPEVLSNGACSLVPHEDRACLSVFIDLDSQLQVDNVELAETVIHSKHRFTYEEALALIEKRIEGDELGAPPDIIKGVHDAYHLTRGLRKQRERNGAQNLHSIEYRFELDPDGEPIAIHAESGDVAHELIEELMLLANRCVAKWLDDRGYDVVYRVHGEPDEKRLTDFNRLLAAYGLHDFTVHDRWTTQRLLKRLEKEPEAVQLVLNSMLLRCFQKAVYQVQNIGHYALAFSHYAHFTSPIRRYPDLIIHRLIKKALDLDDYAEVETRGFYLDAFARQCSYLEQRAERAERDLNAIKSARYLARHLGDEFAGVVMSVVPFGLYVHLLEVGLDGMIPVRDLGNEYFNYYEERMALVGSDSGTVFRIGSLVDVQVINSDPIRGEVTLGLAQTELKR